MLSFAYSRTAGGVAVLLAAASALGGCSQGGGGGGGRATVDRPIFSESEYGVSSSERVHTRRGPLPKGGGSYKLGRPYQVAGRWYVPREDPTYDKQGLASWYGDDFHGRRTANGEIFDRYAMTAAHPTMPLPSYAYVTNLRNGRTVLVRVNDRGPYVGGRIIDMSHAAATALGYVAQGRTPVRVRYAGRAPLNGDDSRERQFSANQGDGRNVVAGAPLRFPEPYALRPRESVGSSGDSVRTGGWSPTAYRSSLVTR